MLGKWPIPNKFRLWLLDVRGTGHPVPRISTTLAEVGDLVQR
jgi:hypothetical protein